MSIFKRICSIATSVALCAAAVSHIYSYNVTSAESNVIEYHAIDDSSSGIRRTMTRVDESDMDDGNISSKEKYIAGSYEKIITESNSEKIKTNCSYMYNMLQSENERIFYNKLLASCLLVDKSTMNYSAIPTVYYGSLDVNKAQEVAWIFHYDHPEFFWMDSNFTYNSSALRFTIYSDYTDGSKRAAAKKAIYSEIQKYIDSALKYNTAYDRAYYLYNQLRTKAVYQAGVKDQSIASVFLEGKTVCAGYMLAYELLCNAVGVDTVSSLGINHGWNAVCLSGQWYYVDVTNGYFLSTASQLRSEDVKYGMQYTMEYTQNGKKATITFYMHDVDIINFPFYYKKFPKCNVVYNGINGKEYISPNTTVTSVTTITTSYTTTVTIITSITPGGVIAGDITANGKIDLQDAIIISKYLLGIVTFSDDEYETADFNCNGKVDLQDIIGISKYMLQ